jgi:transposase
MTRKFKTANYEETLDLQIRLRDVLPVEHLARFIVDIITTLDLSAIYSKYSELGAPPYASEILLGLLIYGYATGVFSSRKIERATYESIPFRFIAGDLHPDHDTIAYFRKENLVEIQELFVQVLLMAQAMGYLQLGNISLDGSKIRADASKSKAVSYKRLLEMDAYLQQQVLELFALAEAEEGEALPEGMDIADEIARRQERLAQLSEAKAILEARAQARHEAEQAEYEEKIRQREAKAAAKGKKPRGRTPKPPTPGPQDKDQYNYTDPESRIMKNSNNKGFDQHYNVQVAVDQDNLLVVAATLTDNPTDRQEALPTVDAISPQLGSPHAAALDNGYFSEGNINGLEERGIDPYIATGRDPHGHSWRFYFEQQQTPLPEDASPSVKMAYKLRTEVGPAMFFIAAIYRSRKCTVEPVIGIIKEILGFRQFSLRGLAATLGEWVLVCLAFNLKRLHALYWG